jgi:hypothetical protein
VPRICRSVPYFQEGPCSTCGKHKNVTDGMDWIITGMKIDHCLVRRTEPHCKLQVSFHILVIVMICNSIKIVSMLWALFYRTEVTFVTFGDAISSWLDDPDDATKGRCLASRREILDLGEGRIPWAPQSKKGSYFSPTERPDDDGTLRHGKRSGFGLRVLRIHAAGVHKKQRLWFLSCRYRRPESRLMHRMDRACIQ